MKVLIINAHPEPQSNLSYSSQLLNCLCNEVKNENIEVLNLYQADIPGLDGKMLELFRAGNELTTEQQKLQKRMQEIMQQFKSAKRIVVVLPLHNFNIPSKLKDYMDNILIARETFRYVKGGGSEGMMTDGRKVLVLQSSGSIYTNNDRYTPLEFSHHYLREMFCNIMGFGDYHIIRMQGVAVSSVDKEQALQSAFAEIKTFVPKFLEV